MIQHKPPTRLRLCRPINRRLALTMADGAMGYSRRTNGSVTMAKGTMGCNGRTHGSIMMGRSRQANSLGTITRGTMTKGTMTKGTTRETTGCSRRANGPMAMVEGTIGCSRQVNGSGIPHSTCGRDGHGKEEITREGNDVSRLGFDAVICL